MPVDYSKWDALELSDDSDVEVHPNVDKRSFIRAKQNQIHQERDARKKQIAALHYETALHEGLLKRISNLVSALKSHASDAATRNPGEVAFQAVMESAGDTNEDQPPERPEGVYNEDVESPTYSKMMVTLLDQVNKALEEKKPDDRYTAMLEEIQDHENKVKTLIKEQNEKLVDLQKQEGKKITSEGLRMGFDSSYVSKADPADKEKKTGSSSTTVELLNPNSQASTSEPLGQSTTSLDDEEEVEASPAAKKFAEIKVNDLASSQQYLNHNQQILAERETDGILVLAFDAALEKKDDLCRQYVHQALLLQYCRNLGRDGVGLFFKRVTTKGHQAQEVFYKDVQDMYMRIRTRAREIVAERASGAEQEVEQIQLHAVEPGTVIQIKVPPADSEEVEVKEAREIFEGFAPEMRAALESGSLDKVNEVLGKMKVDEAEELVGLFDQANILSMEEQIIDATTEEGQKQLKEIEASNKAAEQAAVAEKYDDPE
ncbi:cdc37 hsp90 binding domain-containing protein [Sarocladium implicatum]|nr:cdc37 hsp90 binding domain-containing protein [Sarocladium implicatum]